MSFAKFSIINRGVYSGEYSDDFAMFQDEDSGSIIPVSINVKNSPVKDIGYGTKQKKLLMDYILKLDSGSKYPLILDEEEKIGYLLAPPDIAHLAPGMIIPDAVFEYRPSRYDNMELRRSLTFDRDISIKNGHVDRSDKYSFMVHSSGIPRELACITQVYSLSRLRLRNGEWQKYRHVDTLFKRSISPEQLLVIKTNLEEIAGMNDTWWNFLPDDNQREFEKITKMDESRYRKERYSKHYSKKHSRKKPSPPPHERMSAVEEIRKRRY